MMESVSWDDEIPYWMESQSKFHGSSHHQPENIGKSTVNVTFSVANCEKLPEGPIPLPSASLQRPPAALRSCGAHGAWRRARSLPWWARPQCWWRRRRPPIAFAMDRNRRWNKGIIYIYYFILFYLFYFMLCYFIVYYIILYYIILYYIILYYMHIYI